MDLYVLSVCTLQRPLAFADDTQMTLFTVDGLIRASVRTDRGLGFTVAVVQHAYDRWLDTQTLPGPSGEREGALHGDWGPHTC